MAIKVHHLRPAPGAKRDKVRVGRGDGSGKGKTAGRGTKGTKARKQVPAGFDGGQMPIHMRLPKLRGFNNRFRVEYQPGNVGDNARALPQGGQTGVEERVQAGRVRKNSLVKGLGYGAVGDVRLDVRAHKFSASAKEKLRAAGGSATTL